MFYEVGKIKKLTIQVCLETLMYAGLHQIKQILDNDRILGVLLQPGDEGWRKNLLLVEEAKPKEKLVLKCWHRPGLK